MYHYQLPTPCLVPRSVNCRPPTTHPNKKNMNRKGSAVSFKSSTTHLQRNHRSFPLCIVSEIRNPMINPASHRMVVWAVKYDARGGGQGTQCKLCFLPQLFLQCVHLAPSEIYVTPAMNIAIYICHFSR